MIKNAISLLLFPLLMPSMPFAQVLQDDFEGDGNISAWIGDNCGLDSNFTNQTLDENSFKFIEFSK